MADVKISGLPAATTPLAGTEVLPIVQSGSTKQVSVDNLTAGKAVSALSMTATNLKTSPATANLDISGTTIAASGSDANVDVNINAKGTGVAYVNGKWGVNSSGTLVPLADNTYDIGNGLSNPRDVSVSRNALVAGNVGIGTSAPTTKLTLSANTVLPSAGAPTGTYLWQVGADSATNTVLLDAFAAAPTITGRRAAGTAASPLFLTAGQAMLSITGRGYGSTGYSSGGRASISFTTEEAWTDTAQGARIVFNTTTNGTATNAERMRIHNSGGVSIGDTTDPGAGNLRVGTGNLVIGTAGKGIDFSADPNPGGMTSELLDDYEEGTWTPVVSDAATGGNLATLGSATGYYTKIGRQVTLYCDVSNINITGMTSTNTLYIQGVPFTPTFANNAAGSVNGNRISNPANTWWAPEVDGNPTITFSYITGADANRTAVTVSRVLSASADIYTTVTYFV